MCPPEAPGLLAAREGYRFASNASVPRLVGERRVATGCLLLSEIKICEIPGLLHSGLKERLVSLEEEAAEGAPRPYRGGRPCTWAVSPARSSSPKATSDTLWI